jgi:hypothetical protein
VLQLADIAGPVVTHQAFHGAGGYSLRPEAFAAANLFAEVLDEKGDVADASPQRWNADRHNVQAVE